MPYAEVRKEMTEVGLRSSFRGAKRDFCCKLLALHYVHRAPNKYYSLLSLRTNLMQAYDAHISELSLHSLTSLLPEELRNAYERDGVIKVPLALSPIVHLPCWTP